MRILGPPQFIGQVVEAFSDVLTRPQLRHLAEYLTGLALGPRRTVRAIALRLVDGPDQSSLNRFLTQSPWSEEAVQERRLALLRGAAGKDGRPGACLVLDDTLIEKSGPHIEDAARFRKYDGGYIWGHNIVTCHYASVHEDYPISSRQYYRKHQCDEERPFKTKIALGCELLSEAVQTHHIQAERALFDAAYLCLEMIEHCESLELDWIAGCQSNRIVIGPSGHGVQLGEYLRQIPASAYRKVTVRGRDYFVFTKVLRMRSLKRRVRIAAVHEKQDLSDEPRLLVTNRKDWDRAKIVRLYGRRWAIERCYGTAKHCLGLQECQLRRIAGIHKHWCLVWLAQSLLPLCRAVGAPQKQARRYLRSVEALCRQAERSLLRETIDWVWQAFEDGRSPAYVYQKLAIA
ncbi:MAG: IS701 family transposase [Armatimonadota bacterium]